MSEGQHMKALAKANEIRLHGSEVGKRVAAGEATLRDVFADPMLQGHRLKHVLSWEPRLGPALTGRLLAAIRIGRSFLQRPIRDLTERQQDELLYLLDRKRERAASGRKETGRRNGLSLYEIDLQRRRNGA